MPWLEGVIWWVYRAFCNVLEYVGFFGFVVLLVLLLINAPEWILDWEEKRLEENTCD